MRPNPMKAKLAAGQSVYGTMIFEFLSPGLPRIVANSGAEFIVVICGEIMTMPGLPRVPAANSIKLNNKGEIEGLF